jgi:hypothetical protein
LNLIPIFDKLAKHFMSFEMLGTIIMLNILPFEMIFCSTKYQVAFEVFSIYNLFKFFKNKEKVINACKTNLDIAKKKVQT